MSQGSFDPSKRRLCPDGACVGVIGDDGRCRVCGRAADGSAPPSASARVDAGAMADDESVAGMDDAADQPGRDDATVQAAGDGAAGFRPDRPLCDDGSCVGVIGGDGRCSVCGRAQGGVG